MSSHANTNGSGNITGASTADSTAPPRHQDIVINVGSDMGGVVKRSEGAMMMGATGTGRAEQRGANAVSAARAATLTTRHQRANVLAKILAAFTIILAFGSGFFASQYMSFGAGVTGTFMIVLQEFVASQR